VIAVQRTNRRRLPGVGTGRFIRQPIVAALTALLAVGTVSGVVAALPVPAGATGPSHLWVSQSSGAVGAVVRVSFGPGGNGCIEPFFESVAAPGAGSASLPAIGDNGTEDFVIPSVLSTPTSRTSTPVTPGKYQFVLECDTTKSLATLLTLTLPFTVTPSVPSPFEAMASSGDSGGYWLAQADGGVFTFGDAAFYGSLPADGIVPKGQIVAIVPSHDGKGYWLASADGGVFSFGDAPFFGSVGGNPPGQPIVGMAATADGQGYWEVDADGSVYPFGDAVSYGQIKGQPNEPIVGMSTTADGLGYWLVAADGGVFSYGDAVFHGSMGGRQLNEPVVGMSGDPATGGYWLVAADGGIFGFDAPFYGSTGNLHLIGPITGMESTPGGLGYRFVAADGGLFDFGDANFEGSAA